MSLCLCDLFIAMFHSLSKKLEQACKLDYARGSQVNIVVRACFLRATACLILRPE